MRVKGFYGLFGGPNDGGFSLGINDLIHRIDQTYLKATPLMSQSWISWRDFIPANGDILVGHSFGAGAITRIAAANCRRTTNLVLICLDASIWPGCRPVPVTSNVDLCIAVRGISNSICGHAEIVLAEGNKTTKLVQWELMVPHESIDDDILTRAKIMSHLDNRLLP